MKLCDFYVFGSGAKIISNDDDVLSEKVIQSLALIEKMKNQLLMTKALAAGVGVHPDGGPMAAGKAKKDKTNNQHRKASETCDTQSEPESPKRTPSPERSIPFKKRRLHGVENDEVQE